mmetsp:Transcript_29392/g.94340  ORF Transcript_29392/g.94340 Transcript_29392/m.94340 type:complete len:405 (-) Transcript_29392:83-1297(-)
MPQKDEDISSESRQHKSVAEVGDLCARIESMDIHELSDDIWADHDVLGKNWHPLHRIPPKPANEDERLKVLYDQDLLDTPNDSLMDTVVEIARKTFGVKMAFISLVDQNRCWFKAKAGTSLRQMDRDISLCAYTILQEDSSLWISDTMTDERFKYNNIVHGDPYIRFYVGAPLSVMRGGTSHAIGCLCVADTIPRDGPRLDDMLLLETLALGIVRYIEVRPHLSRTNSRDTSDVPQKEGKRGSSVSQQVVSEFFSLAGVDVDVEVVRLLAGKMVPRTVQSGNFLTRKGDQGNSMYFVVSGACSCQLNGLEIERIDRGGCFGEVAIMNMCKMKAAGVPLAVIQKRCVRMADIRAIERCELLELSFDDAWPLIRQVPTLWGVLEDISQIRSERARKHAAPVSSRLL